jgi:hypothetical protein
VHIVVNKLLKSAVNHDPWLTAKISNKQPLNGNGQEVRPTISAQASEITSSRADAEDEWPSSLLVST